jgi:type IV pilus assembly protein PilY1
MASNYEATADGCICEAWGVGIGGTPESGYVSNNYGTSNLALVSFASTASTATSVSEMGTSLRVTHEFTASASDSLYKVHVTIENISGADIADLRYTRSMDWDIEPTAFSEYTTIGGTAAASAVLYADDNGFTTGNPFEPIFSLIASGDFVDSGAYDHGARFNFGFGALLADASMSFDIFYGAAYGEAAAYNALNAVGAEVYSFGQSNQNMDGTATGQPTFIFGFAGVGGTVIPPSEVPVPAAAWLLIGGLGMLGGLRRRRRSV